MKRQRKNGSKPLSRYQAKQLRKLEHSAMGAAFSAALRQAPGWAATNKKPAE